MNHFAAGKSDALLKLGPNYQPFLIDNKLRLFVLIDNVIDDPVNQIAASKMLSALHKALHNNHKVLDSYAKNPSYANRVRASMMLELALHQAKRKTVVRSDSDSDADSDRDAGMASTIVPSMTVLALGYHSALIAFGTCSGVYHVRNNMVRFLDSPDVRGNKGGGGLESEPKDSQARSLSAETSTLVHQGDNSKTGILDIDIHPGDFFLMASDGLISVLGKGRQLHELCKESNSLDILGKVVENATGVVQSNVVTGVLIKSLGVSRVRDPKITAKLEPLRRIQLLRKLNDSELLKVLALMKVYGFVPGQQMVSTGDDDRTIYICLSGKFDMLINGKKFAELQPGGESSQYGFMNSWPISVKLQASVPSKMLVIPPESVRWLRDNEPVIANKLLWEISDVMANRTRKHLTSQPTQLPPTSRSGSSINGAPATASRVFENGDSIYLLPDDSATPYTYRPPRRPTVEHDMEELGDL